MTISQKTIDEVREVGDWHRERQRGESRRRTLDEVIRAVYRAGWEARDERSPLDEDRAIVAVADCRGNVSDDEYLESLIATLTPE